MRFPRTCLCRKGMRAKEGAQQGNSFGAPHRYAETTWAGDMEWGAAELFRATGDEQDLADAKRYARLAGADQAEVT
jgi:endoglucanase